MCLISLVDVVIIWDLLYADTHLVFLVVIQILFICCSYASNDNILHVKFIMYYV